MLFLERCIQYIISENTAYSLYALTRPMSILIIYDYSIRFEQFAVYLMLKGISVQGSRRCGLGSRLFDEVHPSVSFEDFEKKPAFCASIR
jgi:hypothetical protein